MKVLDEGINRLAWLLNSAIELSSCEDSVFSACWSTNPEHLEPSSTCSGSHQALTLRRYRPRSRPLSTERCRPAHCRDYWTILNITCTSETVLATVATAQRCRRTAVLEADWDGGDRCRWPTSLCQVRRSYYVIDRVLEIIIRTKEITLILRKVFSLPPCNILTWTGYFIKSSSRV